MNSNVLYALFIGGYLFLLPYIGYFVNKSSYLGASDILFLAIIVSFFYLWGQLKVASKEEATVEERSADDNGSYIPLFVIFAFIILKAAIIYFTKTGIMYPKLTTQLVIIFLFVIIFDIKLISNVGRIILKLLDKLARR